MEQTFLLTKEKQSLGGRTAHAKQGLNPIHGPDLPETPVGLALPILRTG